jgi:GT2 family glycosyltransferase
VRSVLASTVAVEVLVVDNASTDDSLADLERAVGDDPRVRVLRNDSNRGFAVGVNQGLAVSRGPFVLLLNPDAVVEPDTIERMLESMREHPDAGLAGGLLLNPDGTEQSGARRSFPSLGRSFVRAFGLWRLGARGRNHDFVHAGDPLPPGPVDVDAISGAFMLARRPALEQVGPMDEAYTLHCEDLDWCARFRQAGWRVLFVPHVTVVHEKGVSSRARPLFAHWHKHRGMIRFYRKFLAGHYPAPVRLFVIAGVALRFLVLAPAVAAGAIRRRWSRPREARPA